MISIEDMQIFRLYEDGSEGIIESTEDIKYHVEKGGILGVHKEDWNALLEYRAMKQGLQRAGRQRKPCGNTAQKKPLHQI